MRGLPYFFPLFHIGLPDVRFEVAPGFFELCGKLASCDLDRQLICVLISRDPNMVWYPAWSEGFITVFNSFLYFPNYRVSLLSSPLGVALVCRMWLYICPFRSVYRLYILIRSTLITFWSASASVNSSIVEFDIALLTTVPLHWLRVLCCVTSTSILSSFFALVFFLGSPTAFL